MKAIIADVDDTICLSIQPIQPEMAAQINRLVAGGIEFAFISGSTVDQIKAQVTPFLTVPHHLLGVSGTHYVKVFCEDGKPVFEEQYHQTFSSEERAKIMSAFHELIEKYAIEPLTTRDDQLQDRGSQITFSIVGRHAPPEIKRAADPDGSRRSGWIKFLRTRLGDGYSMRIGGTTSIDVTALGVDKSWGIHKFMKINNIRSSEILFLGDKLGPEGNDYPALKLVDGIEVKDHLQALEFLSRYKTTLRNDESK